MSFPCRQFVGAAVIALMALSGTAPIGCHHAHALAHADSTGHGHVHPHQHNHPHHHHHHDGEVVGESLAHQHDHTHVFWLGMQFVVDGPMQSSRLPDEERSGGFSLVKLWDNTVCKTEVESAKPLSVPLFGLDWIRLDEELERPCGTNLWETARSSPLLCDVARHACTGVLLS